MIVQKKRKGSIIHQLASYGLPQPYNLRDVVIMGDNYAQHILIDGKVEKSSFLVVAELPIQGESQYRPDFVVFKKTDWANHNTWKPIAVLDLKTKQGFDWGVISKQNKSGKYVPYPRIKPRELSKDEWGAQTSFAYNKHVERQLLNYEKALVRGYQNFTYDFKDYEMIKGVVIIDTKQKIEIETNYEIDNNKETDNEDIIEINNNLIHQFLYSFIHTLDQNVDNSKGEDDDKYDEDNDLEYLMNEQMCLFPHEKHRIAIITDKQPVEFTDLIYTHEPVNHRHQNYTTKTDNNLTLYLSGASRVNFGNTAAWIAAHYHLMQKLQEEKHGEIIIIDMLEILKNFTYQRLRIDPWLDLSRFKIVYPGELFREESIQNKSVIISGWGDYRQIQANTAHVMKNKIITKLRNCDIYLISNPVKDTLTSKKYKMRGFLPYNSYHAETLNKIIWNLPVAPVKSRSPKYDNIRVIVTDTLAGTEYDVVELKGLRKLAKYFTQRRKQKVKGSSIPLHKLKKDEIAQIKLDVLDLITWINSKYKMVIPAYLLERGKKGIRELPHNLYIHPFKHKKFEIKDKINGEMVTRKRYSIKTRRPEVSYQPPDTADFGFSYLLINNKLLNTNKKVIKYLLDKRMSGDIKKHIDKIDDQLKMVFGETIDVLSNQVLTYERENRLSGVLSPFKFSFYMRFVDKKFRFNQFKAITYWLDLMLLAVSYDKPLLDEQIILLWQKYSPWLLLSLGYEYEGNHVFDLEHIWSQLKIAVSKSFPDTRVNIKRHGIMRRDKNRVHLYFDEHFQGAIKNFDDPHSYQIVDHQYNVEKFDKLTKISILLVQIGNYEYIYKKEPEWELFGRVSYDLRSRLETFKVYPSMNDLDLPIEEDLEDIEDIIDNIELVPNYVSSNVDLEFENETQIRMTIYCNNRYLDGEEIIYSDLSSLIHDLREGSEHKLEVQAAGKSYSVGWDKFRGVFWGELIELKALIYVNKRFKGELLKKYESEFPEDIRSLYYLIHEMEEEKLELFVEHNEDRCPLKDFTFDEIEGMDDFALKYVFHTECWDVSGGDFSKRELRNVLSLNHRTGFTAQNIYDLHMQGHLIHDDVKYNISFEFGGDTAVFHEDWRTLQVLRETTRNYYLQRVLPLSHKLDDKYQIESVNYDYGAININARSIRSKVMEFRQVLSTASIICARYMDFEYGIKKIISSNEFGEISLVEEGLSVMFDDVLQMISEHQEECGCTSEELCYEFGGVDIEEVDDEHRLYCKIYYGSGAGLRGRICIKESLAGIKRMAEELLKDLKNELEKYVMNEVENRDITNIYYWLSISLIGYFGDIELLCKSKSYLEEYFKHVYDFLLDSIGELESAEEYEKIGYELAMFRNELFDKMDELE